VVDVSVTLRDAQHMCWKSFRVINDKIDPERGKTWKPSATVAELAEKVREIDDVVKRWEDDRSPEKDEAKEALAQGLSDVLSLVFVLAEHHEIELEEAFMQAISDYMMRFVK